jgi:dihydroflavonol-4-reductase
MDYPFWNGTPVCVLGGNGFLGRHLVRALLAQGARVVTLSLPGPVLESHTNLEERTGTVADRAAVRAACAGARVVFLAAGPVGVGGSHARGMTTHTSAVSVVAEAAPPGVPIVLTSSIVAVGATRRGDVLNEEAPFPNARLRVEYVRAKRAAEEEALSRGAIVVNPGYLFGPDDPGLSVMGELCLQFWRGRVAFPPPGGISCADVRDVAEGHLLAAERGAPGTRYILSGENLRFTALFAALASAGKLRRAVVPSFRPAAPGWAYWCLAAVSELGAQLSGKNPVPSFEFVRMFRLCWFVSSERAKRELGYAPRPLAETLRDAFEWHAARTRVVPRGLNRLWLRPAA